YVYTDDVFVNLEMVKAGYANLLTIPPDVKYADDLRMALSEARHNKRGLWKDK
ncbi:MAG: thermonuclease family protein, partial [Chlamydiota bacterium]|nr:thermonuclease family protein [Chlamydiota bacterium]